MQRVKRAGSSRSVTFALLLLSPPLFFSSSVHYSTHCGFLQFLRDETRVSFRLSLIPSVLGVRSVLNFSARASTFPDSPRSISVNRCLLEPSSAPLTPRAADSMTILLRQINAASMIRSAGCTYRTIHVTLPSLPIRALGYKWEIHT